MTNIHSMYPPAPGTNLRPKSAARASTALLDADRRHLKRHLKQCEVEREPFWPLLAHVLHHKIMTTEPVVGPYPCGLAVGGSLVTYSLDGGAERTGLLTHWARSGILGGVIPVASLLGATLIGMWVGQRTPLLCEDGTIVSLSVLAVVPPN